MRLIEREKCPLCECTNRQIVYSLGYGSQEIREYLIAFYSHQGYPEVDSLNEYLFQLAECEECKLIYQVFVPDDESLTKLYTKWIAKEKVFDLYLKKRGVSYAENHFLTIRNLISFIGTHKINLLDYGFGYGYFLQQAKLFGIKVFGYEFNNEQVQIAKNNEISVIHSFENTNEKMDVIFCEQVLEHVVEPRVIMQNIVKVAKKGTILHIGVPDAYNVKNILLNINWQNAKGNNLSVNAFAPLEHINSFCHSQLIRLTSDFGFKIYPIDDKFELSMKPKYKIQSLMDLVSSCIRLSKEYLKYKIKYKPKPVLNTSLYFIYEGTE